MFKIETDVPIVFRTKQYVWPWRDMGVGDSVFIKNPGDFLRAQSACHAYGYKMGKKFTTRKVDGGLRVWRIE